MQVPPDSPNLYPPAFGKISARYTNGHANVRPALLQDAFAPQFAGARLKKAKRSSMAALLLGLVMAVGTGVYASNDNDEGSTQPSQAPPLPGNRDAEIFEGRLGEIAWWAEDSAQSMVPPASGNVAHDVVLRQIFCDYLTQVSAEVAAFNNQSRQFLQPDNIADCFPETVFDPTAFSTLMENVYASNGWHSVEANYEEALHIIFGNDATRLSEADKQTLLSEAERAFRALEESDRAAQPGVGGGETEAGDPVDEAFDQIRQSKILMALFLASGALIGVGGVGWVGFGVADRVDAGIQSKRAKRKAKKALKELSES